MNVEELKNKARELLGNIKVMTFIGEAEKIKFLTNIVENDISGEDINALNKKLDETSEYLTDKQTKLLKEKDFEFLKNIAEILRNQKVRIEDGVYLENPVFKVTIDDEKGKQTFYFLTKEGADKFIEANKTLAKDLHTEEVNVFEEDERRKEKMFNVERNQNLELERLIEIIKRNF